MHGASTSDSAPADLAMLFPILALYSSNLMGKSCIRVGHGRRALVLHAHARAVARVLGASPPWLHRVAYETDQIASQSRYHLPIALG